MDRLQEINRTLSSQLGRLRNIQNTVKQTENLAEQAQGQVENTEGLIDSASNMLHRARMAIANVVSEICILSFHFIPCNGLNQGFMSARMMLFKNEYCWIISLLQALTCIMNIAYFLPKMFSLFFGGGGCEIMLGNDESRAIPSKIVRWTYNENLKWTKDAVYFCWIRDITQDGPMYRIWWLPVQNKKWPCCRTFSSTAGVGMFKVLKGLLVLIKPLTSTPSGWLDKTWSPSFRYQSDAVNSFGSTYWTGFNSLLWKMFRLNQSSWTMQGDHLRSPEWAHFFFL